MSVMNADSSFLQGAGSRSSVARRKLGLPMLNTHAPGTAAVSLQRISRGRVYMAGAASLIALVEVARGCKNAMCNITQREHVFH
jgi:hypothetical protein